MAFNDNICSAVPADSAMAAVNEIKIQNFDKWFLNTICMAFHHEKYELRWTNRAINRINKIKIQQQLRRPYYFYRKFVVVDDVSDSRNDFTIQNKIHNGALEKNIRWLSILATLESRVLNFSK